MKDRPWIWIVVAHVVVIAVLTTVVMIAKRYPQVEVPLTTANARTAHGT